MNVICELIRRGFVNSADNYCTETIYLTDLDIDEFPELATVEEVGKELYKALDGTIRVDGRGGERISADVNIIIGADLKTGCYNICIRERNVLAIKKLHKTVEINYNKKTDQLI